MNATTLTEVGMFLAAVIGLLITFITNRKKGQSDQDMADVVSWKSLNAALQLEVNRLSSDLKEARQEIQRLEAKIETLLQAIRGTGQR